MDKHAAVITMTDSGVVVKFTGGVWTRALIDSSYKAMLRYLPAYLKTIREKEASDARTKRSESDEPSTS
jgi:hypothetical protein